MELRVRIGINGTPAATAGKLTGPLLLFPPRTPIRYVAVEKVEQGHVSGDEYIALSFGPQDPAIPVQAGDCYAGLRIAERGVYAWYKVGFNQKWFIDVLGTDRPVRLGAQTLIQDRIPGFGASPGYPFE